MGPEVKKGDAGIMRQRYIPPLKTAVWPTLSGLKETLGTPSTVSSTESCGWPVEPLLEIY